MRGPVFVVEGVLAGMSRPPYGENLKTFLRSLKDEGIGALVSLTPEAPDAAALESEGIEALRLPVRDFSAPTVKQIDRFVAFVRQYHGKTGRAVAVHCGSGLGRTGTMLACFLVAEGRPPDQALAEVRRRRPGSIETDEQEEAVHAYSRRIEKKKRKRKRK